MRPTSGFRDADSQAKLWRQSRSTAEIKAKIKELRSDGADYLADVIERVGVCNGPAVTTAIPGFSWHNYGLALDCGWFVNGVYQSDWAHGKGYQAYAEEAIELKLYPGLYFPSFQDGVHVQASYKTVPTTYTLEEINEKMKERGSKL